MEHTSVVERGWQRQLTAVRTAVPSWQPPGPRSPTSRGSGGRRGPGGRSRGESVEYRCQVCWLS